MTRPRRQVTLGRLVMHSAFGISNVGLLVVLLFVVCIPGQGLLAAGLSLLYAFRIAKDVSTPSLQRQLLREDSEMQRQLPVAFTLADPELQLLVASIGSGFAEAQWRRKQTFEDVEVHTRAAGVSLEELVAQAGPLFLKADKLYRYLRSTRREWLVAEVQRLEEAGRSSHDDAKVQYERAASIRGDQLAAIDQIRCEHSRTIACLQVIAATIESFSTWTVRMRLYEGWTGQDCVTEATAHCTGVRREMASSQLMLEGLAQSAKEPQIEAGHPGPTELQTTRPSIDSVEWLPSVISISAR